MCSFVSKQIFSIINCRLQSLNRREIAKLLNIRNMFAGLPELGISNGDDLKETLTNCTDPLKAIDQFQVRAVLLGVGNSSLLLFFLECCFVPTMVVLIYSSQFV